MKKKNRQVKVQRVFLAIASVIHLSSLPHTHNNSTASVTKHEPYCQGMLSPYIYIYIHACCEIKNSYDKKIKTRKIFFLTEHLRSGLDESSSRLDDS